MKNLFGVFTLLFFLSIGFIQAQNAWKERDDFHTVMSQTFHPAEEGNFKPIRERSAEMVKAAMAWRNSPVPADLKEKADLPATLDKLIEGAKKLDKAVKANASDKEIMDMLSAEHDVFHTIVGLCRPEKDGHGHEHGKDGHDGHKH